MLQFGEFSRAHIQIEDIYGVTFLETDQIKFYMKLMKQYNASNRGKVKCGLSPALINKTCRMC